MNFSIARLLSRRAATWIARIALTFPFWSSGFDKLINFSGGMAEMTHFGFEPAVAFNIATIVVQIGGSLLIVANRLAWLGAGALAIFTGLTILLVHRFWAIPIEPFRTIAFYTATEHIGMVGGLLAIAVLSTRNRTVPVPQSIRRT
ncbi:DoxX family protein [Sphingomonas sp. UYP23]